MRNISVDIFESGPVVQEMSFNDISYLELWWLFCLAEWNICAILSEGIMMNISVNLYGIWAGVSGGNFV